MVYFVCIRGFSDVVNSLNIWASVVFVGSINFMIDSLIMLVNHASIFVGNRIIGHRGPCHRLLCRGIHKLVLSSLELFEKSLKIKS